MIPAIRDAEVVGHPRHNRPGRSPPGPPGWPAPPAPSPWSDPDRSHTPVPSWGALVYRHRRWSPVNAIVARYDADAADYERYWAPVLEATARRLLDHVDPFVPRRTG